jgi:uroporphyrin-III C-methyltransferase/precorrin-2 dehydrogenase/sirohydrochlorin ferrochelatase
MSAIPIFLDLAGRRVLILGTGEAADRRAATYEAAGARIERAQTFDPATLPGCALAAGAGAPEPELRALSAEAQRLGIPINVVDRPDLSSFSTPSIIDRPPLTIAIATGGTAPILARMLRQKIEALIPPAWGRLAALAGRMQNETRAALPEVNQRRRVLERILSGRAADLALSGDDAAAEAAWRAELRASHAADAVPTEGFVHLVGAGPGAADLVSLRALRLLGEADVIVHDRLGTSEVLALARRDATRIDVGKALGEHTMPQAEINALLIHLAREGSRVVRLKGGDPFIFGRGGEEIEALRRAGIACAVVPGITAALACAASAGIPLTHRDHAHAVTFVTAHRRRPGNAADLGIDYAGLLRPGVTLAIYMGLATLPRLRDELEAAGFDPAMPAVLVEDGGTDHARVLRGPLAELADQAGTWASGGPVLTLLGGTAGA